MQVQCGLCVAALVLVFSTLSSAAALQCITCSGAPGESCCNPKASPAQLCPGGITCCDCGGAACSCNTAPAPPSPPTPTPTPAPPTPPAPTPSFVDSIAATDYEMGYCTSLSPTADPPQPSGYWCSTYNRGSSEGSCWMGTQNCCYLDMNKTIPDYPGTGQCVHIDPCAASGEKLCGTSCHPLRTSEGLMMCIRPKSGASYPKYTQHLCVGKATITDTQFGEYMSYICNPAVAGVNCDMINSGGAYAYPTPGFHPPGAVSYAGTYSTASWALNQQYVLTGTCDPTYGDLVGIPTVGPPVVPTPQPVESPTPSPLPTPVPTEGKGWRVLLGAADCSTAAFSGIACPAAVREYSGRKAGLATVAVGWADPTKLAGVFQNMTSLYDTHAMIPVISWLPYPYKTWTNPSPNVDISNGVYDDYIQGFFGSLRSYIAGRDGKVGTGDDRRAYIKFAPEANGNFFPWAPTCPSCGSTGQNISQSTASYVTMWKHVRQIASATPGVNDSASIQWIWSVNNVDVGDGTSSAQGVFPGVSLVDWAGVDGLNFGTTLPAHAWQSPSDVAKPMLETVAGLVNSSVPLALTTLGSTSTPNGMSAKGQWLSDAVAMVGSLSESTRLGMALLFNEDTSTDFAFLGGSGGDGQVTVSGVSANAFSGLTTAFAGADWMSQTLPTMERLVDDSVFKTGRVQAQ